MNRLRVAIAEMPTIRSEAIRNWLSAYPDLAVAQAASSVEEAVAIAAREKPQVVLLDLNSVPLHGAGPVDAMRRRGARVVALCSALDQSTIASVIRTGVDGYVVQIGDRDELVEVIRRVASDGHYYSTEVTQAFTDPMLAGGQFEILDAQGWELECASAVAEPREARDLGAEALMLTERERQVLSLVATGHNSQSIANGLAISVPTVRKHRENLARKLGLHNTAEATAFAIRHGILAESSNQA